MLAFDLLDEFRIFPPELIPAGLPYLAGLPELKTTCLECLLVFVVELTNVAGVGAGGPATGSSDGISLIVNLHMDIIQVLKSTK